MTESAFEMELEAGMEAPGGVEACGEIDGEGGTDEFIVDIVGP